MIIRAASSIFAVPSCPFDTASKSACASVSVSHLHRPSGELTSNARSRKSRKIENKAGRVQPLLVAKNRKKSLGGRRDAWALSETSAEGTGATHSRK